MKPLARALSGVAVPPTNPKNVPRVAGVGFSAGLGAGLVLALLLVVVLVGKGK